MHIRLRIGGVIDAAAQAQVTSALTGDTEVDGVKRGLLAASRGKVAFAWSGEGDEELIAAIETALGQASQAAWRLEASFGAAAPVRIATRRGDLGWTTALRWVDVPGMAPSVPLDDLAAWLECEEGPVPMAVEMMHRIMGQGGRPELPGISLTDG